MKQSPVRHIRIISKGILNSNMNHVWIFYRAIARCVILLNDWGIVHSYWSFISLLILSWYALLVIVSSTSLSWEIPLKVTRLSPQYDSSRFLSIHQFNVDIFVRVSDARWEWVCKRNRFRVWIHLKIWLFPNINTISNSLGSFNCMAVLYSPFGLSLNIWPYCVASNLNTQNALKISFKSKYVKLYNLCNQQVNIHQSQSSDSLLIHSIASSL